MKLFGFSFGKTKRELFWEASAENYLSKSDMKLIKKSVRKGQASYFFEKIPISFLLAGSDLLPQVKSETQELADFNSFIRTTYFQKAETEFSSRAFDVIPHFIAPELKGLIVEKRVAVALIFSQNLKVLFVGGGKSILDFVKEFDDVLVKEGIGISRCHVGERLIGSVEESDFVNSEIFDFVFLVEEPMPSKKLLFEPSEGRKANFDFFRSYVRKARSISVNSSGEAEKLVGEFIAKQNGSPHFYASVLELAKSIARVEMRSRLTNKDVALALEIADKSIKK